jgi:hypothetical protein
VPSTTPPLVRNWVAIWHQLGQSEIEDGYVPPRADHEIRGFDVAMDHALGMRGVQSIGHLRADRNNFGDRKRLASCAANSGGRSALQSLIRRRSAVR